MDQITSSSNNQLTESDLHIEWFSGTGKGGQHRNKHQNSIKLTHKPTNITVTKQGRLRKTNYQQAHDELTNRVNELHNTNVSNKMSKQRKELVGSGMRADKIITIRMRDDKVMCHTTNKSTSAKRFMRGDMKVLVK